MAGGIINLIMILKPLLSWKILFHLFFHRIFRPRFYARIMLREGGLVCTNGAAFWSSRRIVLSEKTTGWEVFLIYHCYWVFSFQLGWYSNILMIFHYVLAHPLKKQFSEWIQSVIWSSQSIFIEARRHDIRFGGRITGGDITSDAKSKYLNHISRIHFNWPTDCSWHLKAKFWTGSRKDFIAKWERSNLELNLRSFHWKIIKQIIDPLKKPGW